MEFKIRAYKNYKNVDSFIIYLIPTIFISRDNSPYATTFIIGLELFTYQIWLEFFRSKIITNV